MILELSAADKEEIASHVAQIMQKDMVNRLMRASFNREMDNFFKDRFNMLVNDKNLMEDIAFKFECELKDAGNGMVKKFIANSVSTMLTPEFMESVVKEAAQTHVRKYIQRLLRDADDDSFGL